MGRRRELRGLRILVTGASQGIGRAIAAKAAAAGMRVIATARNVPLLEELAGEAEAAGGELHTTPADIAAADGRRRLFDSALEKLGGLDVLCNNAGVGATGHFVDCSPETLRAIMEVNFFAVAELIRLFLPTLKNGTAPAILNISSVLGRRAIGGRGLYSASKFALQGFSEALRGELDKDGVDVLIVNPGLTQTNFSGNMLERKGRISLEHMRGMTPDQVADVCLKSLAKGRHEVTLTRKGRFLVFLSKVFPKLIDRVSRRRVRKLYAEEIAALKGPSADAG